MYKKFGIVFVLGITCCSAAHAQKASRSCGNETMYKRLAAQHPGFEQALAQKKMENAVLGEALAADPFWAVSKTTASYAIPVVFHIVLTPAQINQLGGTAGIEQRLDSQMRIINRDFNAQNADSTLIPAGFKSVFGNTNIRFGLAHRKPDGSGTPGYEILTTTSKGFEESSTVASGMGYTEAKFLNGATTAWDVTKYLNVWVINPLENGSTSGTLGLCIPPSFAGYNIPGFSQNEIGLVINYGAFGARSSISQYFIYGITGGRTMTHELGHFFELEHIWGDDNGGCPGSGGYDDGISDTPPQADATFDCPVGTKYDGCSATGNGIMYMNYMDYVNDACMVMFTKVQAGVMYGMTTTGKESWTLTQNPQLTEYPTGISEVATGSNVSVYPNPANGVIFLTSGKPLLHVKVSDISGRVVKEATPAALTCELDMTGAAGGIYMIQYTTTEGSGIQKILVQ